MSQEVRYTIGPLFGEAALSLGLVRATDVLDALCEQQEQRSRGEAPQRIGQILIARGKLTREGVATVMQEVERRARGLDVPGYHSLELVSRDETTLRFRGVALGTRRPVMIKVLRFCLADSPEDLLAFDRECGGLGRLEHVNLVRLLDSGDLEGIPYLVLEHVQGPDLRTYLDENVPMPVSRALELARAVADAHALAILHASLRPSAILLPRLGGPKVTDFTLFEWNPEESSPNPALARSPHYLSPEQARGGSWPTVRSDVYSLGATLYTAVTGRPPFRGTYREILRHHQKRVAPDPRVHVGNIPAPVAEFVLRMLEKDPARRPDDMREVAATATRLVGELEQIPVPEPALEASSVPSRLRSRRPGR